MTLKSRFDVGCTCVGDKVTTTLFMFSYINEIAKNAFWLKELSALFTNNVMQGFEVRKYDFCKVYLFNQLALRKFGHILIQKYW